MKKIKLFICFSLFIFSSSFLFGQSWEWATQGKGPTTTQIFSIHTDVNGNAYESGIFQDTLDFGPTHLTTDSNGSCFLVKYDSMGVLKWAVQSPVSPHFGLISSNYNAVDGSQNVYITGTFLDTVQFGVYTLISPNWSAFLVKHNRTGTVSWAKLVIPGNGCETYCITTDKNYNIYVTGVSDSLGYSFAFMAKFDSSGNEKWFRKSLNGGKSGRAWGHAIATDKYDNIYETGNFWDTVRFGSYTLNAQTNPSSMFVVKYDSSGNVIWATQSSKNRNVVTPNYYLTSDSIGNTYIGGAFMDTLTIGTFRIISNISEDIFLVKYDANGHVIWCEGGYIPNPTAWSTMSISCDENGHIYLLGGNANYIKKNIELGNDTFSSISHSASSLLVQLDTNGTAKCGLILDSTIGGRVLTSSPSGRQIYLGGVQGNNTIFGPDTISYGTFVSKWNPDCILADITDTRIKNETFSIFPNPFTNSTTILVESEKVKGESYLELYDLTGRQLKSISFTGNTYTLSAEGLAKGMYFIRVFGKEKNVIGTSKIVVQ